MSKKRQYFSGNTIEQAVLAASSHYHVDPDRIAYRQVEKRHGFVKIRRRVVIKVNPDQLLRPEGAPRAKVPPAAAERPLPPERAAPQERPPRAERRAAAAPPRAPRPSTAREEPPAPHPSRPPQVVRERPAEAGSGVADLAAGAREAVERLLRLGRIDARVEVGRGEDRLEIDLSGPDRDLLLDEEGEMLQALEYLVPRVMRGIAGDAMPCRVDSGNFRRDREEELAVLARRTADAVRERGRPITLEPMSPTERRIVHLTLADDPRIATESEGEGEFRQVVVSPA